MPRIDHICLAGRNLYETAERLREETGLGNYDSGWMPGIGIGQRLVPLGGHCYIEVESIIDQDMAKDHFFGTWFQSVLEDAGREDRFMGWVIAVDTMDELTEIANRIGLPIATTGGEAIEGMTTPGEAAWDRRMPDGKTHGATHAIPDDRHHGWPRGLPNFMVWPDEEKNHPDSIPQAKTVQHRNVPRGISWVEVGDEALTRKWLGPEGDQMDIRYVDGPAGLYAVGIRTDQDDIVIRRKPVPLSLSVNYVP